MFNLSQRKRERERQSQVESERERGMRERARGDIKKDRVRVKRCKNIKFNHISRFLAFFDTP